MNEYINKHEARQLMKAYRSSLDFRDAAKYCHEICDNILGSGIISDKTKCVLSFASYGTEPDTGIIDRNIRLQYKRTYLAYPKVCSDRKNMEFYIVNDYSDMIPGYMNIPEPDDSSNMVIPDNYNEFVMIVPGLAFDMMGARAGYGGGFYDRYLEMYPKVTKAAVCYDKQLIKDGFINRDKHDILMDYIITEKNVVKIKGEY